MQYPQTQPPYPPPGWQPAPVEHRRFNIIAALVLWPFIGELYRDVARRWRGIGFFYLVLLAIIAWAPFAFHMKSKYMKFLGDEAPQILQNFPKVTINNGVVSADPDPYLWADPKTRQAIVYIDTSGAFADPAGKDAIIKLSRTKLESKQDQYNTRVVDLSQVKSFYIDKNSAKGWLDKFAAWIIPIFIGIGVLALIWHFIQTLIYGIVGLIFASMFNASLGFGALMRLSAIALTPAVLLDTGLSLAGASLPVSGLIFVALELFFLGVGVRANASNSAGATGYPAGYPPQGQYPPAGYPPPPPPPGYAQPPSGYSPPR